MTVGTVGKVECPKPNNGYDEDNSNNGNRLSLAFGTHVLSHYLP